VCVGDWERDWLREPRLVAKSDAVAEACFCRVE